MKKFILLIVTFASFECHAFEAGEPVYAKIEYDDSWLPVKYSTLREDCFITQRDNTFEMQVPSNKVIGKIAPGAEVSVEINPRTKLSIKYKVVSVGQKCHAVERGMLRYAKAEDVISAAEFKQLIGSKADYSVGSRVYAVNPKIVGERWVLGSVTGKRQDCYETNTGFVVHGEDVPKLYKAGGAPDIKVSHKVLVRPNSLPSDAEIWWAMKVKKISGSQLTVSVPYTDAPGEYTETVKISDVKGLPVQLNESEFTTLKPQAELFEYRQPESCEGSHYYPFKIRSPKRSCELVTVGSEVVARMKESLIPADRLTTARQPSSN